MKKIFLLIICMFCLCAYAQELKDPSPANEEDVVFMVVEEMPQFPGGQQALFRYLSENVKYPVIAQENGIQGRVICQFIVDKDGSITNVEVVKSGGDASLDKEAVRVIKSMPNWKPGKQRGKPVRVKYTVPVNFRLQDGKSQPPKPAPTNPTEVHVGDTICPNGTKITHIISGYCCDSIFVADAPKTWSVNLKGASDYYVITDEYTKGVYNFTRYTDGVFTGRGRCLIFPTGAIRYMDTLYYYKDGKLAESLLYTPVEMGLERTKTIPSTIPLKARIYGKHEQLLREYRFSSVPAYVAPSLDWDGYIKAINAKPIAGWKEFYKDGFYSESIVDKDNTPKTIFYTAQGKKATVRPPKLKTPKKNIQTQLEEYVPILHTNTDMHIQMEIKFHVDEAGNVLDARCGRMNGEFPVWYNNGKFTLYQIEMIANKKLKDMSFEFEPGIINKMPQRMIHTIMFSLQNNSKFAAIPSKVHEGDTLWFESTGIDKVIYKGDTIRYSPKYQITNRYAASSFYATIHETEDGIVEWHIHDLAGNKKAVLRHADHSTSAQYVGAKDYYQDNRLVCSEFLNTSDNSYRIVWYNSQEKKEKEYLLTENNIVRQCNLYKEEGRLYQEFFYYPDYVLDYGFEYDDNDEKHLIKPEKKEIPWQVGDTVTLRLLKSSYEAGIDIKQRYFMYRDDYMIANKQDNVDVYGIVEAVANDTLWVVGYERSTGLKTCRLCYCSRTDNWYAHTGLQMFYDNKGLPMSGVTYQHETPIRSHWYKNDGTEYLCFDLKITNRQTLIPSQMTWLVGQSFKLPEIKNAASLIKSLNNSLDLKKFETYFGRVIVQLIAGSDGSRQILVNQANLGPITSEKTAMQLAAKEIQDCLGNILASWDIAPAKAGDDNVSMPMVLVFEFKNSSGFVSVQSAHQGAKY